MATDRRLTLDDIADLRAYEREREQFRAHVIALKKRRRVPIGPHVSVVFENRDTIRFQIQEMARAERIITDEGIQTELDIYNPVIPQPGTLSATLFIELTSEAELREWLPRLVGIERSLVVRFGGREVHSRPESSHEAQLTREEVTAAVHYVWFDFSPEDLLTWDAAARQVPSAGAAAATNGSDAASGAVELAVVHPEYQHATPLRAETVAELTDDLTG